MKPLEGKTALVTGAERGIGAACALKLAEAGADIALACIGDPADLAVSAAASKGVKAAAFKLDVTDSASCKEVFAAVEESLGGADILVNAETLFLNKPLLETTDEEIDLILKTNLYGIFYTSRAAARHMMKKRWGRIINIAGFAAFLGVVNESVFSASKGGLAALTKTLAKELGSRNITVNAVAPGLTDAPVKTLHKDLNKVLIDDYLNYAIVKRLGKPDEVADAVASLALPSAEYITGQVVHVNGGLYI
jgi:3-oxoacyl-[acyl-carrier protein] reductase